MEDVGPIELGSFPVAVYVAMFAATLGGQFCGVGLDMALHVRSLWVPLACGTLLEAVVGARYAAAQVPRRLTVADWGRLSAYYSTALAALSAPLALWTAASQSAPSPKPLLQGHSAAEVFAIAVMALVAVTLVRWGGMVAIGGRYRRVS